ncbi:MAG: AMP-binding protein [Bdellovibrionaceae bacterium]|jgi:o-succinylbenzoate---CoA ligase|nr:AMP-binding protein [Pseudobdellovibrionaceae bacterium]
MRINWDNDESHYIYNGDFFPQDLLPQKKGIIWLSTSGSSGGQKLVALSKQAFLISAYSVNQFINSDKNDVWLNLLPLNHVGGLAVLARAHLSGARVVQEKWENWKTMDLLQVLTDQRISLMSLVPTHVFDIVQKNLKAPEHLRCIFVGGGKLSESLYVQARKLGWNLLPTYGMTECCSQVATAPLSSLDSYDFPKAQVLPHMKLRIDKNGTLIIKSDALLNCYVYPDGKAVTVFDPIDKGWFTTEDIVELSTSDAGETYLNFLSRKSDTVKVLGELVNLTQLNFQFKEFMLRRDAFNKLGLTTVEGSFKLLAHKNERAENQIDLLIAASDFFLVLPFVSEFNQTVKSFEKIQNVYLYKEIPKGNLNKPILRVY